MSKDIYIYAWFKTYEFIYGASHYVSLFARARVSKVRARVRARVLTSARAVLARARLFLLARLARLCVKCSRACARVISTGNVSYVLKNDYIYIYIPPKKNSKSSPYITLNHQWFISVISSEDISHQFHLKSAKPRQLCVERHMETPLHRRSGRHLSPGQAFLGAGDGHVAAGLGVGFTTLGHFDHGCGGFSVPWISETASKNVASPRWLDQGRWLIWMVRYDHGHDQCNCRMGHDHGYSFTNEDLWDFGNTASLY